MPDGNAIERLVIFGATGDLAARMLIPSLYFLDADNLLPKDLKILGSARTDMRREKFVEYVEGVLKKRPEGLDEAAWKRFSGRLDYCAADVTKAAGMKGVAEHVGDKPTVFYLALSPSIYGAVCKTLDEAGLACGECRIVLEKPLGHDLESSKAINAEVGQVFEEARVFRIDHYLGKETVQNLLALRFANTLFEPLWNNLAIDHVQITVAETEGVGERWRYYDDYGALRDMVQNHMMQLLCLVAMEPPADAGADSVRDEKVKVLKALRHFDRATASQASVRGQYRAGVVEGRQVPAYVEEKGGATDTETFVALRADIDNWRWAGVPFYLRTGKRLPKRVSEVAIQFKDVPQILFNSNPDMQLEPTVLSVRVQPEEGLAMRIASKLPGPKIRIYPVKMEFNYASGFGASSPEAYERLILDVMAGDATLFMRRDQVEAAWQFVTPVLERWEKVGVRDLPEYQCGTWGPVEADRLIEPDGRFWRSL